MIKTWKAGPAVPTNPNFEGHAGLPRVLCGLTHSTNNSRPGAWLRAYRVFRIVACSSLTTTAYTPTGEASDTKAYGSRICIPCLLFLLFFSPHLTHPTSSRKERGRSKEEAQSGPLTARHSTPSPRGWAAKRVDETRPSGHLQSSSFNL